MIDIDEATFADFVAEALADIPPALAGVMSNVEVMVVDRHDSEPDLLGLYEGIPLTERGDSYAGVLPDRIMIYRLPILAICETVFDVIDEVRITVIHEVAHHFGIDDDALHEWGWG
ncbi:MAG: metallopeptidase family protein [Actinobacteria bacterium]|nr:metallopeptidase family protein [Actinomycetota bacterium]MCB9411708.1 metallopeptidase family protein [Actinomycetota bacterium]